MKTNFKKFAVIAVAVAASSMAGCKKDQSAGPGENSTSAPLSYKITDRLQVNNEDGMPRAENSLPLIGAENVAFSREALNNGRVTLKTAAGENVVLTVAGNDGGELTLTQSYAAAGGLASGTIYYSLISN